MGNISKVVGGPLRRKVESELPAEDQFTNLMIKTGLDSPSNIIIDGKLHRFSSGKSDKSCWYILFDSSPCVGVYGDWRTGMEQKFVQNIGREYTIVEQMNQKKSLDKARKKRDLERKKSLEVMKDAVVDIWDRMIDASKDHPYLKEKGIKPHGARVTGDGRLAIPLYTPEGDLQALQYIGETKRFHNSSGGCMHMIGPSESKIAYLVEGFADACTVVEEVGCACYIAFSGSNMANIAPVIKSMGSHSKVIVIADNDEHGRGLEYAKKASASIGSSYIMPPDLGDINDYRLNGGDVSGLLAQKKEDPWIIEGSSFCKKPSPLQWFIKGWIQKNALHMIHGPSGSGKTFLVLDMMLSISNSIDWFGTAPNRGNIVYLAGEGHYGLKGRLAGWAQERESPIRNFWVSKSGCDLNTPDGFTKVIDSLNAIKVKPDIVVVDTLHRFLSGDENSAVDAKTMLDACSGLMEEFGCSVLLVHHTGVSAESQERARGSSSWRGALDIEINIKPADRANSTSEKKKPFRVRQVKSKDAEAQEDRYFSLKSSAIDGWFDEDGEAVKTAILEESCGPELVKTKTSLKIKRYRKQVENAWLGSPKKWDKNRAILDRDDLVKYLIDDEEMSQNNAEQELKPSSRRLVHSLVEDGFIERDNEMKQYILLDECLLSTFRLLK